MNDADTVSRVTPQASRPSFPLTARVVAGASGLLYAFGLVITSLHLWRLGIEDFGLLRVQFLLVGLGFAIFTILPSALLLGPLATYLIQRARGAGRVVSATSAVLMFVALFYFLALPFHYFVTGIRGPYLLFPVTFWVFFNLSYVRDVHLFFIDVPLLWLLLQRLGPGTLRSKLPDLRVLPLSVVALGVLCSTVPYAFLHYPNVSRAVGGGQPAFVSVRTMEGSHDTLPEPLLLWHADEQWIYFAVDPENNPFLVQAMNTDVVSTIQFWQGEMIFRAARLTPYPRSIFSWSTGVEAPSDSDFQPTDSLPPDSLP